jgi:hypothetical protein
MDNVYAMIASFREIPRSEWTPMGGIIAAAVAVGLMIFFARRRRAAG